MKTWHGVSRLRVAMWAWAAFLAAARTSLATVFFAGHMAGGKYVHDRKDGAPCYGVRYCSVTAALDGNRARTTVEATVAGTDTAISTVGLFPVPDGTDEAALAKALPGSRILSAEDTGKLLAEVALATGRPQVLAIGARRSLLLPELRLDPRTPFVVVFDHEIGNTDGLMRYSCPLPVPALSDSPVEKLTVNATVRNGKPLRGVFSPTHPARVARSGSREAVVSVAEEKWSSSGDFALFYAADDDPAGLRILTYRDSSDDDGYFLLFGCPSGGGSEPPPAKDMVFVLDTSGSMRGEKIEQARAAVEYCLKRLNAGDRFNIITFGTEVRAFRDKLTGGTGKTLEEAGEFMEGAAASGRTNIGEALARALADSPEPGRMRIMIFLTDGTPTAGELVPERILEKVSELNRSKVRIFVVGVGNDVNAHLLGRLAEMSDGSSEYVGEDEEIDVKVAALFNRLSNPVLSDAVLAFGDLKTTSVYPRKMPALFEGQDIMVAGRYRGGGRSTVTVSGSLAGKPREFRCTADFPDKAADGQATEFVASLWAARSIGFLLQEIRLHGPSKELIEEVVRLSTRFGIVTEYTAFLADSPADLRTEEVVAEAEGRMREANARKSGRWAVAQAKNDIDLQQRVVAASAVNAFTDQSGEKREAENVRQVGRRAFYLRNDKWVESEGQGDRKERKVKLFSAEYFSLVAADDGFRQAQEIGGELSINVGNERIVVER